MDTLRLLIAAAPLAISGCATSGIEAAAAQRRFQATIPTCGGGKECEVKWAAARRWVLSSSSMKIQHYSPDFIETFNPEAYSAGIAARVTKEPFSNTDYRIVVEVWCNNLFGCVPPIAQASQAFNDFVNHSWAAGGPAGLTTPVRSGAPTSDEVTAPPHPH